MKNKIIKLLGGFTFDEVTKIDNHYKENIRTSLTLLKEWRRGMPMIAKDVDVIDKCNKWLANIIINLPITKL